MQTIINLLTLVAHAIGWLVVGTFLWCLFVGIGGSLVLCVTDKLGLTNWFREPPPVQAPPQP